MNDVHVDPQHLIFLVSTIDSLNAEIAKQVARVKLLEAGINADMARCRMCSWNVRDYCWKHENAARALRGDS